MRYELTRRDTSSKVFDPIGSRIIIRPARSDEYAHLAGLHYRAGPPATRVRTLGAYDRASGQAVGVLVVSMPVLNASWREAAWPGRYLCADKRESARRINRELRAISRVIVDPRWRGVGIACALVRAYLCTPLSEKTEAVAAMGGCCRFFRGAGMREFIVPPSGADTRLRGFLAAHGIAEWTLADPVHLLPTVRCGTELEREVRRWSAASRGRRARCNGPVEELLVLAASVLLSPARAYASGGLSDQRREHDGGTHDN